MNCPKFIQEFKDYVDNMGIKIILEVGAQSGELMNAVGAVGIDLFPKLPEVEKCDIRDYKPSKKFTLVFSSGLLEHYDKADAIEVLKAMANASKKYVLTYVPHTNCKAYMNAKARTKAPWKDELDYTMDTLAALHEEAGLIVVDKGVAAKEWAKKFGPEPSDGYLVFVLAKKA
jgi:hypothetical protein